MKINDEETWVIVEALRFYINNYKSLSYEELRNISDLKERIIAEKRTEQ